MAFVTMTDGPVENSNTDVHETEWGVSVSERAAQKTPVTKALIAAALAVFALASIFLIPVLVGLVFFGVSKELLMEVGVIAAILGLVDPIPPTYVVPHLRFSHSDVNDVRVTRSKSNGSHRTAAKLTVTQRNPGQASVDRFPQATRGAEVEDRFVSGMADDR